MIGTLMVGRAVSQNPQVMELASRGPEIQALYQQLAPESWQQLVQRIEAVRPDAPATGSADQPPVIEANFRESLGARFRQAGNKIQDPVINSYYEILMDGMSPAFTGQEGKGLADQLPDIEHIYRQSLTTPFQAAGVEIQSPETRSHYQRLTEAAGLVGSE